MKSFVKSGLINAAILFVLSLFSGLLCQLCPPVIMILSGAASGYFAARWRDPAETMGIVEGSAIAGAIAGIGGILGQSISAGINYALVMSSTVPNPMEQFTGPLTPAAGILGVVVWFGVSIFGAALAAGAGAVAGLLMERQKPATPA